MHLIDSKTREASLPEAPNKFKVRAGAFFETRPNSPHYLLTDGLVIVYAQHPQAYHSQESVCLGLYSPSSILGEPLGSNLPYNKKVRAVRDSSFRAIPRDFMSANPADRIHLVNASDHDKSIQEDRITLITSASHMREKLAWALLALTSPGKREVPVNQTVLADLIASTRTSTNSILRELEKSGILASNSATYRVTEPAGVEKLEAILKRMNPHLIPK